MSRAWPQGKKHIKDPRGSFLLHFQGLQDGDSGWAPEAPLSCQASHLPGRLLSQTWLCQPAEAQPLGDGKGSGNL